MFVIVGWGPKGRTPISEKAEGKSEKKKNKTHGRPSEPGKQINTDFFIVILSSAVAERNPALAGPETMAKNPDHDFSIIIYEGLKKNLLRPEGAP